MANVPIQVSLTNVAGVGDATPHTAHASTGRRPPKPPDTVQWNNHTGENATLTFTAGWPFTEAQGPISVPDRGHSDRYHVDPTARGTFPYSVTLDGTGTTGKAGGPPGDPSVLLGD